MALKFFDDVSPSSGNLPFLNEFVKKAKNLKTNTFEINEIKRVKSDKGYLASTDKFMVFLWKNAKITQQMVEALDFYINSDKGYALVIYLPNTKSDEYKLGVDFDKEVTWFTSKNGYTTTQEESVSKDINPDKNPFLPD
jgi:hypothetical protein